MREVFLRTAAWATLVSLVWFLASECFPGTLVSAFTGDPQLKQLSVRGLRLMNFVVLIVGFQMVATNFFQSLGMVAKSIFLSLTRQLLYLVPLIYLLPHFKGVDGVFLAFPLSDTAAFLTTLVMIILLMRKFARLQDGDEPDTLGSQL